MAQHTIPPAQKHLPPILDDSHLKILNEVLVEAQHHAETLQKFRDAGTPMEPLEEQVKAMLDVATGYKRQFFPQSH